MRLIFRPKSEIQRFFPPKNRWFPKKKGLHQFWDWFFGRNRKFKGFFRLKTGGLQKKKVFTDFETDFSAEIGNSKAFSAQKQVVSKKKGLHRFWDWFFGRNRKFKGFFRPKTGGLQKKKVFTDFETDFLAVIGNSNVWGRAVFQFYFQVFTKNQPQNHQKRAILHTSQANGGGLEPPPPPPPWLRYWPLHAIVNQFNDNNYPSFTLEFKIQCIESSEKFIFASEQ